MQNPLSNYLDKDLRGIISGLTVVTGTAKESGNIYYAIELTFINGYKKRMFLKDDERFAWVNAMDQLETSKQVNVTFAD